MMNEIEPLLCDLEKCLGAMAGILPPVPAVSNSTFFSASTAVGIFTSAATVAGEAPLKKRHKDFESMRALHYQRYGVRDLSYPSAGGPASVISYTCC